MNNYKKTIINIFLILSILLTIYFAIVWFSSDDSGESGFAILAGVFIPILLFFRNQFKEKNTITPTNVKIKINNSKIRCYQIDMDYAIQLDIEIYAKQKSSLKKIYIEFKEDFRDENRIIDDFPIYINNKDDLLQYDLDTHKNILQKKEKISKFPLVINELEHKIFTIYSYIEGERFTDGWYGLNLNEWYLCIEYNEDKKYKEKLLFEIHKNSINEPSEYKYVGFSNR